MRPDTAWPPLPLGSRDLSKTGLMIPVVRDVRGIKWDINII